MHTVGIDRIIEQAGVAKASLYNTFGSKDELVRAYLETRHASVTQRITQAVERYDTPRERLLAVFEGQGELFAQPDYRGCAFARASAESHPGDLAEQATEAYRRWVRALLTELAARAGVPEPEILARQLHLLYDGSGQSARLDHDPAAAAAARAAAAILLDAALARITVPGSAGEGGTVPMTSTHMIVLPGGGYAAHAPHEAEPVARLARRDRRAGERIPLSTQRPAPGAAGRAAR